MHIKPRRGGKSISAGRDDDPNLNTLPHHVQGLSIHQAGGQKLPGGEERGPVLPDYFLPPRYWSLFSNTRLSLNFKLF